MLHTGYEFLRISLPRRWVNRLSLDRPRQPINPVTPLYENHAPKITDTVITIVLLCRSSQVSVAFSGLAARCGVMVHAAMGTSTSVCVANT